MNLSPFWVEVFERHGFEAIHWSQVGDPAAPDHKITPYRPQFTLGGVQLDGSVQFKHSIAARLRFPP